MLIETYISIITLNVNGLNAPIKMLKTKQELENKKKKQTELKNAITEIKICQEEKNRW